MKSLDTKSWIESWMPPEAIAGQRHADIYDVLCDISENPNHHLISLDCGKAFDYVNHTIAVAPFSQLGLNPQICQVLMKIWSHPPPQPYQIRLVPHRPPETDQGGFEPLKDHETRWQNGTEDPQEALHAISKTDISARRWLSVHGSVSRSASLFALLFSCSFGASSASPCTSNLVELNTSLQAIWCQIY